MKNRIILPVAIALICSADDVSTVASPKLRRGRGLRKNTKKIAGNEDLEEVCVNLGSRSGQQTFTVPKGKAAWFAKTIHTSRGATIGACKQNGTKLSKRRQKVKAFCCHFGQGDDFTLYAPRAARRWLSNRGVRRGECKHETGPGVKMILQEIGDENTILGYNWEATDIVFDDSGELEPTLDDDDHPITIFFESEAKVHGKASCNRCFGNLVLFTDKQLRISWMATTRMMCHPRDVMDQESAFVKLMMNKTFFYKVVENASGETELLLYETDVAEGGEEFEGDLMARFIKVFE